MGADNIAKFGHLTKKERKRVCIMCDSKCDAYREGNTARFTPMKGHKMQNAENIYWDCRFYSYGVGD